jgi:AcrR family transcriptional regulator
MPRSNLPADTAPAGPVARRQPAQARSRERMDLILSIASTLIAEHGSGPLKMSQIAELAGISIGSLYQYFPDKRAVIRTLAEQFSEESRRCIEEALGPVQDQAGLETAFSELVDLYHAMLRERPVMQDIASGMRADKELAEIERAASKACGTYLADVILRVHPGADAKRVGALAFLVWQLGEETMRLALATKRSEALLLVEAYKRMSLRAMAPPWA